MSVIALDPKSDARQPESGNKETRRSPRAAGNDADAVVPLCSTAGSAARSAG